MTDDIRSEMTYYKQLAIAVEEKISKTRLSRLNASAKNLNSVSTPNILKEEQTDIISHITCSSDDESLTRSTNINKYRLYRSHSLKAEIESSKITSEFNKPRDIFPVTFNKPRRRKYKSFSDIDDCDTKPGTLVRQGSYTLETPSSMLLAYLDNGQNNSHFYTPTISKKKHKRKEWDITQTMNDWTEKNRKIVYREINSENDSPQKIISFNNLMDENNLIVFGKSVDSIQHILSKDNALEEINKQHISIDVKNNSSESANSNKNQDINRTNKLGGSLETLNKNLSFNNKQVVTYRMAKSLDISPYNKDYPSKSSKRGFTSERLLHVFKEIQKTHEKQMAELVQRQKQEQIMMQKTFEKQQIMMLDQIIKAFSGIPVEKIVRELAESNKNIYRRLKHDKQMIYNKNLNLYEKNSYTGAFDFACPSGNKSTTLDRSSYNSDGKSSADVNLSGEKKKFNQQRRPSFSRQLFPLTRLDIVNSVNYNQKHVQAATIINAYARGYLVRRLMKTERVITLKNTYKEALHYMLKLHIDAPLELPELEFHQRLQHQCDASSINIVELFSQSPVRKMKIISDDRQIQKAKMERSTSARSSISFATQRTLERKRLKQTEMNCQPSNSNTARSTIRSRCQTWTANSRKKHLPCIISAGIKRSTSAGAVRKPWR